MGFNSNVRKRMQADAKQNNSKLGFFSNKVNLTCIKKEIICNKLHVLR